MRNGVLRIRLTWLGAAGVLIWKIEKRKFFTRMVGMAHIPNLNHSSAPKKNIEVYPVKVAKLRLPEKYPDDFENAEQMPTECEYFEFTW